MKNDIYKIYLNKKKLSKKENKKTYANTDENLSMNVGMFQAKLTTEKSPVIFSAIKCRPDKEKKVYYPKIRQISKSNANKLLNTKDLIIDTRNKEQIMNQNINKFNFVEYRHKKYQNYRAPVKVISSRESKEKDLNYYTPNSYNEIDSSKNENLSLRKRIKNMKHQIIERPINGSMPRYALTYDYLPHHEIGNSLYTVLSMRKNQFFDSYNKSREKEKKQISRIDQMKFLKYNNTPLSSYLENNKDYTKQIDLLNQPFSYISLLNDDYAISEKMRFQKIMEKLTRVKKCILENPSQEFEIVKEFLLNIGLYKLDDYDMDKLNNFLKFIKSDFLIDPAKDIKENVIDILNNNNIDKPPISNALDCINEEYLLNEIQKRKNLIKHKKIGEYVNCLTETNNDDANEKTKSKRNKSLYKSKENISRNKSMNYRRKQNPLQYKGLCVDLKRQQEIILFNKKKDLDIVNSPKEVVDMIEKEIKTEKKSEEKYLAKTHYNWCKNIHSNKRLYGERKDKPDYNEIKKKNMLTEYICLIKAKNNMELRKLKEKYKI